MFLRIDTALYGTDDNLRKIMVIAGIPFYKSSGENSGYPGTWLPFIDVATVAAAPGTYNHFSATRLFLLTTTSEDVGSPSSLAHDTHFEDFNHTGIPRSTTTPVISVTPVTPMTPKNYAPEDVIFYKHGYIHKVQQVMPKPMWSKFCTDNLALSFAVLQLVEQKSNPSLTIETMHEDVVKNIKWLEKMFPCLQIMVISALFGGGFWDTLPGVNLKKALAKNYSIDFVAFSNNTELLPPEAHFDPSANSILDLNAWLIAKGSLFTSQVMLRASTPDTKTAHHLLTKIYQPEFTDLATQERAVRAISIFTLPKLKPILSK